ncbi:hypothetical protein GCM10009527_054370 [Actinomadura nitritigenes]|uniref:Uncharacterized protein n=1 Tax=Actinomadura nitritigenes TaxID=134602 RepID=A0ABS3RAS2_9ACTN|nr:hypothetical protein [Actinomadura nitritigenes]MBO2442703.1 hypothetical protein [Actinomadura nitritigenes]
MGDPTLIGAAVVVTTIVAGVVTTWLRTRSLERLHRERMSTREAMVRRLAPKGRLIDVLDGRLLVIEVGERMPPHDLTVPLLAALSQQSGDGRCQAVAGGWLEHPRAK